MKFAPRNIVAQSKSLFLHLGLCTVLLLTASVNATTGSKDDWGDEWGDDPWAQKAQSNWSNVVMFAELAWGTRLNNDPVINTDSTLQDIRVQGQADYKLLNSAIKMRGQAFYDGVQSKWRMQIRELNWQGKISEHWDIKAGQQILTWGTGDYLFLNDMFAKDWQSFFSGRDDEYLKAPQFAFKASGYYQFANIDIVITPQFTPDRYINGDVFSFYNPLAAQANGGVNVAPGFDVSNDNTPDKPEYAFRLKKQVGATEYAFYGYKGFDKSPNSMTEDFQPTFTALNVVGASVIAPLLDGLVNVEVAHHNTADQSGDNPLIPNTQNKLLIGYQQELISNLTGSIQFQFEKSLDLPSQPNSAPSTLPQSVRTLWTAQLYYRLMQDTLNLQLFNFYSPSDKDGYSRFKVNYQPIQDWTVSAGINKFWGKRADSFFGQFEDASNAYITIRHYF